MQPTAPLLLDHHMNVALLAAELVSNRLRARPALRIILPTGHTPVGMYAALRAHAADGSLPSEQAILFQLDEYVGVGPANERSFRAYLERELAGVRFGAAHHLNGAAPDPDAECARHQALLDEAPIDLVVLGLGRDGHVAFDEPGSPLESGARQVPLQPWTREDAAADFGAVDTVPKRAMTVGLRTLVAARELLMLVSGEAKAEALRTMLEGERTPDCPASLLRDHPRLTVICDRPAGRLLRPLRSWSSDRALIVLGHREPSVSAEHRISDESRARIRRAVRECRAEPPRAVILTGYTRTPEGLSEAEQMKTEWPLPGVPIVLENAGRNTAENATRSLPLIQAIADVRRVTVVTSAWHVRVPYFFASYRRFGFRMSFAAAFHRPWLRMFGYELRGLPSMHNQRRRAVAELRSPAQPALPPGPAA